jgi:glycosyltransferase involved in cell wall biosynthesis
MAHEHRREVIRDLAATADRFIAVSRWHAEAPVRNGVPAERVEICRQGVDRHPPDRRPIARADAATLKVGFLGRYHETKGLHVLVQAMRMLPAEAGIELHVWGVARTPDARDYRDRIERLSSGVPAVVLHDEARAEDIYPHIDVLCVPSVYFETGPLVVLEAHAWGVPVVGTNIGGIPERVEDGVTGFICHDIDEAVGAVRRVDRLSRATCRARFEQRFTAQRMTRDYVEIYRRIVTAHEARASSVYA